MLKKKFLNWFKSANDFSKPKIFIIDIKKLKKWNFTERAIHHESNRFFNFKYYKVLSKIGNISKLFYAPFIVQREVGILGILIKKFKKPIVSTSANLSGKAAPNNFQEINKKILEGVGHVVNLGQKGNSNKPSSIIKITTTGSVTVIRK